MDPALPTLHVRPAEAADQPWIHDLLRQRWGSPKIISRGYTHHAEQLPALVAEERGQRIGVLTYAPDDSGCEIVTLDSIAPGQGVGTALMTALVEHMRAAGARRIWVTTTNDNLAGLRFYQKCGFVLTALRPDAIAAARALKREIPLIGNDGIPIRDEIELELDLSRADV